jgi:hypothetical protein
VSDEVIKVDTFSHCRGANNCGAEYAQSLQVMVFKSGKTDVLCHMFRKSDGKCVRKFMGRDDVWGDCFRKR